MTFGAHYTLQLKNDGNANVEAANQPGIVSVFGDYPEILGPALDRYSAGRPARRLPAAQGPRLRHLHAERWAILARSTCRRSGAWTRARRSATSAAGVPLADRAGAQSGLSGQQHQRGHGATRCSSASAAPRSFEGYGVLDFASTYSIPVWKTVEAVVQGRVLQPAEQRQADQVGHHGHGRSEQPEGRQRPGDRLHPGRELRQSRHRTTSSSSRSRHQRRTVVQDGVRAAVLRIG